MTSIDEIQSILHIGETQNTEFKRRLTKADLKLDRRQKLVARIRFMTCESPFEGQFLLGIEDISGKEWKIFGLSEQAIKTAEYVLGEICEEANVEIVEEERIETDQGYVGVYLLKRIADEEIKETCSINVAGRVNSGKSTLIGALVTGLPDNGSGKTRSFLLTHPQEITRGQTADIHLAFLGYSIDGESIHLENPLNKEETARVLDQSAKILTFFDAPGHQEYSKTMIRSILGADAQYGLILVPGPEEANLIRNEEKKTGIMRLDDITREHLILMSSQEIPVIVAISKVDKTSAKDLELVESVVRTSLKEIGRIPVNVRGFDDIPPILREIGNGIIVPMINTDATDLSSLKVLNELLKNLPSTHMNPDPAKPAQAYVDKVYRGIRGTNVVVTGTVKAGVFKKGQTVVVGPNTGGNFSEGRLFSVEMFKKRVGIVRMGDLFGFDIKDVDKHDVRRGQVVADPDEELTSCRVFEANIVVTRHPTRITVGYTPVLQCHTIQHTVVLKKIYDAEFLTVGDFAKVQLEFMMHPEAIGVGDKIVLREANTRAIGTIVDIIS
ncbi:MAG: GTP-binding protein [Candidatus Thorarchaeota archaeon]|jgi:elongation factor 1-alpha